MEIRGFRIHIMQKLFNYYSSIRLLEEMKLYNVFSKEKGYWEKQ